MGQEADRLDVVWRLKYASDGVSGHTAHGSWPILGGTSGLWVGAEATEATDVFESLCAADRAVRSCNFEADG